MLIFHIRIVSNPFPQSHAGFCYSEKQTLTQTGRQLALELHQHQECFVKALREELEAQVKHRTGARLYNNLNWKAEIQERKKAEHAFRWRG